MRVNVFQQSLLRNFSKETGQNSLGRLSQLKEGAGSGYALLRAPVAPGRRRRGLCWNWERLAVDRVGVAKGEKQACTGRLLRRGSCPAMLCIRGCVGRAW